jgi:membrane dipeptidase
MNITFNRVQFGFLLISVFLWSCTGNKNSPQTEEQILAHAQELHNKIFTIDSHVDIPGEEYATEKYDPGIDHPDLRCDLVKMKRGGLDGVFLAVYVRQDHELTPEKYDNVKEVALKRFAAIHRLFDMYPDRCELALTPNDFERIASSGKRAIMIGLENGFPVAEELDLVNTYYDLGARYITLSHTSHNQICDSSGPDSAMHGGLSDFGKTVVTRMNELGMMCDVSHISEDSFFDVIETSRAPIIASHSGCSAIHKSDRNLTDDQLMALKKNGGVIQIVALEEYLGPESPERQEAIQQMRTELGVPTWDDWQRLTDAERETLKPAVAEYYKRRRDISNELPIATIKEYVDHIDHAVKIAGIDHVGIGTDFDGGGGFKDFQNHAEALNVTIELVRRGYSEKEIAKIWGGNLLRVWRQVEKIAAKN